MARRKTPRNADLAGILESITDGFVALDRDWRYTYVNAKAGQMLGRDPKSLIGRHIWTEFPEGVGQPFHLMYERAMREQAPCTLEAYYPPWDRWFENRIYPSADGLVIYFTDITERKRADATMRQERDFSSAVLDSLPGIFYMFDSNLRYLRWNANLERVTGYSGDEIRELSPLDFFTPDDRIIVAARIADVFSSGESSVEAALLAKDGTRRPYFFTGRRSIVLGQECLLGVGIDISARVAAEAQAHESSERLRLALEAARMGTFDWDVPANQIKWSVGHEQLWGFAPGEFRGTYEAFASRVHPEDLVAVNALVEACIAQRLRFEKELRVVLPDGRERWISGHGDFTFDADGRPLHMRGVVVDVTSRKRADEQIRRSADALRALAGRVQEVREEEGRRIARELHDQLGQSLTALKIDTAWVDQRLPRAGDSEVATAISAKLAGMARQIDDTVRNVRRIATELRPPVLDDLGLVPAVEWQAAEFQKRTGIDTTVHASGDAGALGDVAATALFRIVGEALTNVARHAHASRVEITLTIDQHHASLAIADNGVGLPGIDDAATSSLGLIGMRERARAVNGEVRFAANQPTGTIVTITVRRDTAAQGNSTEDAAAP